MTNFARNACTALIASSFLFGTSGCSSAPETLPEKIAEAGNWIDEPGNIKDVLAATGAAKIMANPSAARTRAEADGRAKIAATAKATVQSLVSNWAKETGDLNDERTVASYLNDEILIRQLTDAELIGVRAARYATRDGVQYVLMIVDDPEKWTRQVGASLKDRALKDQTLWKTEVLKRDFEEKLDKLINRDAEAVKQATQSFEQNYVK